MGAVSGLAVVVTLNAIEVLVGHTGERMRQKEIDRKRASN